MACREYGAEGVKADDNGRREGAFDRSGPRNGQGRPAAAVTGVFATVLSVVGFQILNLGLHAKTYSWSRRFDRDNTTLEKFYRYFKLEAGLVIGTGLVGAGATILFILIIQWLKTDMLPLPHPEWASFAATLVIIGCTTAFSSLFISTMSMERRDRRR